MTPTDRVRAKLDAHGVEWESRYDFFSASTFIKTREGNEIEICECMDSTFAIYDLTPEQAGKIGVFLA